jgi:hypothetical protein
VTRARLEVLGWWFHERAPDGWPRPQRLVGTWRTAERAAVLRHLRAGSTVAVYPRRSICRFACGERAMGNRDVTDGVFVWPDGLVHYVHRHGVRLPAPFVAHVMARRGDRRPFAARSLRARRYDAAPWLRWARAEGACLDLAGWEVPDARSRQRIRAELGRAARGAIVLCRTATREVVLAQRDGSLVVPVLRAGAPPPRRLRGWNEWPVAGG